MLEIQTIFCLAKLRFGFRFRLVQVLVLGDGFRWIFITSRQSHGRFSPIFSLYAKLGCELLAEREVSVNLTDPLKGSKYERCSKNVFKRLNNHQNSTVTALILMRR